MKSVCVPHLLFFILLRYFLLDTRGRCHPTESYCRRTSNSDGEPRAAHSKRTRGPTTCRIRTVGMHVWARENCTTSVWGPARTHEFITSQTARTGHAHVQRIVTARTLTRVVTCTRWFSRWQCFFFILPYFDKVFFDRNCVRSDH